MCNRNDFVETFEQENHDFDNRSKFLQAFNSNDIETLSNMSRSTIGNEFTQAFNSKHIETLIYLFKTYENNYCSTDIYFNCIRKGYIKIVEALYNDDIIINPCLTINIALYHGHSDIVSFVINKYRDMGRNRELLDFRHLCILEI